jgi:hypothetical protein
VMTPHGLVHDLVLLQGLTPHAHVPSWMNLLHLCIVRRPREFRSLSCPARVCNLIAFKHVGRQSAGQTSAHKQHCAEQFELLLSHIRTSDSCVRREREK